MKLPELPRSVDAIADYLYSKDESPKASSDLVRDVTAYGKACAIAALEDAYKKSDDWTWGEDCVREIGRLLASLKDGD